MPVYTFTFPEHTFGGAACTITDSTGSTVHTTTLSETPNDDGAIAIDVTLDEGFYVGTAVSTDPTRRKLVTPGVLDVAASIAAAGGGGGSLAVGNWYAKDGNSNADSGVHRNISLRSIEGDRTPKDDTLCVLNGDGTHVDILRSGLYLLMLGIRPSVQSEEVDPFTVETVVAVSVNDENADPAWNVYPATVAEWVNGRPLPTAQLSIVQPLAEGDQVSAYLSVTTSAASITTGVTEAWLNLQRIG